MGVEREINHPMNEEKYQARAAWLGDRGSPSDVMEEDGVEYVVEITDDGEGQTTKRVRELPPELQTNSRV